MINRLVIAGMGQLGAGLVHHFSSSYDIVAIDTDIHRIRYVQEQYDVQGIIGNACDPRILEKAHLNENCAFVAVTKSDETNLLACQMAQVLYHPRFKALRIRSKSYNQQPWIHKLRASIGIDLVIQPEKVAAQVILNTLHTPGVFDQNHFCQRKVYILGLHIQENHPFCDKILHDIYKKHETQAFSIFRIIRGDQTFHPYKDERVLQNDFIYVLTAAVSNLRRLFSISLKLPEEIVLLGAGPLTDCVCELLAQDRSKKVVIIEDNQEEMDALAVAYPAFSFLKSLPFRALVWETVDCSDRSYMVAMTPSDSMNILSCLMAQKHGMKNSAALVQEQDQLQNLFSLGVQQGIYPTQLAVSALFQALNQRYVENAHLLHGLRAGMVFEIILKAGARALSLSWLQLEEEEIHVLALVRKKKIFWRSETFLEGDHIIVSLLPDDYVRLDYLFAPAADRHS